MNLCARRGSGSTPPWGLDACVRIDTVTDGGAEMDVSQAIHFLAKDWVQENYHEPKHPDLGELKQVVDRFLDGTGFSVSSARRCPSSES